MPIDYTTSTSIVDTLKYVYGEGIKKQFETEKTLYNILPKSNKKPAGLGYQFSISYADPQGIGARGESAKLPDPLVGKYDKAIVLPKYVYGSSRLTGPAMEAGKGNAAAFIDSQSNQIDGIYRSMVHDLNRQCWGDGYGKVADVSASGVLSTSTTWSVTCDNDLGIRYLRPGMLVDFYESANVDQSSVASRITSIDYATKVVTFEANDGTYKANHPIAGFSAYTIAEEVIPVDATIVKMGTRDAVFATSDTSYEMTGLLGIFDDGTLLSTFQGIDVSSHPAWKANILDNSGSNRELTLDLLLQACDATRTVSGRHPEIMYMGLGQKRKYANLLTAQVRFAPTELKGGYEVLTFAAGEGNVQKIVEMIEQLTALNQIGSL